jgi:transcriptional/translational regulatory protein YebC/TACO1
MFDKKGIIVIEDNGKIDEEELMMVALDAGADDFTGDAGFFEITTSPEAFSAVCDALESAGYETASAEVSMIPQNYTTLTSADDIKMMNKLLDMLEDNDDVQNVWHSWDTPDEE